MHRLVTEKTRKHTPIDLGSPVSLETVTLKLRDRKMQDRKMADQIARPDDGPNVIPPWGRRLGVRVSFFTPLRPLVGQIVCGALRSRRHIRGDKLSCLETMEPTPFIQIRKGRGFVCTWATNLPAGEEESEFLDRPLCQG